MTQKNEVYFRFPSLPENIAFARSTVAAFAVQIESFTSAEYNEIRKAVSEAVSNCVQHAYPDSVGVIEITASIEDNTLTVVISDQGVGIEDIEMARKTEYTTKPGENLGLGFNFMESSMDVISVESDPSRGTKLIMKKSPAKLDE